MAKPKQWRISKKQRIANAYAIYRLAWDLYDHAVCGDYRAISQLLDVVEGDYSLVECRAASIGLYHKYLGEDDQVSLEEFTTFYQNLENSEGGIFIMDAGVIRSEYEVYLTTYFIDRLDNAAVFTALDKGSNLEVVYNLAIEDSRDEDRSAPRVSEPTATTSTMSSLIAPIAASVGVALFTQLMSKSKEVVECQYQ